MRIAYVCADPGIPVFGTKGASIHVQEMLRAFAARGAEVTLISPRIEGTRPADLDGIATRALTPAPKGDAETRAQAGLALNDEVAQALSDLAPLDLIYERHALYAHAAMEVAAASGVPGILEVNAPLAEEQARHRTLALADTARETACRAMSAAHGVAAVSPAVADHCRAHGATRVEVIANAISPGRFPSGAAHDGPFTIGFLGSLKPWHDVATALEAFAALKSGAVPEARFLIVGDGPERERLQSLADALGVSRAVTFAGAVGPDEVPAYLGRMHVGLAPYAASDEFYFSPLKLYEYMAAGLAVVASRVGHMPDVVDDGRLGLLTSPGDAAELAARLGELAASADLRAGLGRAAREHVMTHRTWDGVALRVLDLAGLRQRAPA